MKYCYVVLFCAPLMGQPAWDDHLDHETIEQRLSTEAIVDVSSLQSYLTKRGISAHPTHDVRIVKLESGLLGVFKRGDYHHGEVAAYRASKALGLRLVPPTVYRRVKGMEGSMQFYIEAPSISKVSNMKSLTKKVGPKAVSDMRLFYYVFGQWDVHSGNQLIASYGDKHYLALIDNSVVLHLTYDTYGGSTFTSKGKNDDLPSLTGSDFPYDEVQRISGSKVTSVLKPYVGKSERARLSRFGNIEYVVWNYRLYIKLRKKLKARFTKTFYQSTLDAYKALSEQDLNYVWQGWAMKDPEHADELGRIALQKRDEILSYAYDKGTIYEG